MKKLSELGISPAPWKFTDNLTGTKKQFNRGDGLMFAWLDSLHLDADARLIAAAPKLYEALYDILRVVENRLPSQPTLDEIEAVAKAKSALAEAAGESDAHDE